MRPSRTAAFLLVLALFGAAPAATSAQTPGSAPDGVPEAELRSLIDRMVRQVNDHRAFNGVGPVRLESRLAAAAQAHADDMIRRDYFDHRGPDGRGMQDRATAAGYPWRLIAENLGAGFSSPVATADSWMTSPAHRANMLDPDHVHIGVGYARPPESGEGRARYRHYWVILLGAPAR
ncbi:MAG: CAP domain-containing protein [Rhodospirillaceae bacterium]